MTSTARSAPKRAVKPVMARRNPATASRPKVTTHKLVWRHAVCRVRHTPDYINTGWSMLELTVVTPKGAPLPITATGYKSHFLDEDILIRDGGPVAYFSAWLDREATTKAWAKAELNWRQGDLFASTGRRRPGVLHQTSPCAGGR